MSRSWLLYLDDLIESAEKIGRFVAGRTFASVSADEAVFDAILFNLQVIGEVVKKLPDEARSAMPDASGSGPARLVASYGEKINCTTRLSRVSRKYVNTPRYRRDMTKESPNQGAAANRHPALQSNGSDNLSSTAAADRAFPAAVVELGR